MEQRAPFASQPRAQRHVLNLPCEDALSEATVRQGSRRSFWQAYSRRGRWLPVGRWSIHAAVINTATAPVRFQQSGDDVEMCFVPQPDGPDQAD